MGSFFSLDGPFYKYGGMLADVMILSIVWIFSSLLIVTIGASTTAMFYVVTRRIANREGYILRDYWKAFKENFKKSTLLTLIILLVGSILIFNIRNYGIVGGMPWFLYPIQILFFIEMILMTMYIFPLAARFDMKIPLILKSALFMANRHLLTSLTCVVLLVALLVGVMIMPPLVLVAPGVFVWLASYMIIRIFKRYRPEMDKDPMLEIAEIEAAREAARKSGQGESIAEEVFSEDDYAELENKIYYDNVEPENNDEDPEYGGYGDNPSNEDSHEQ